MDGLSRKQVAEKLGISGRTVWFYTEQGIVTPAIHNPKGKGTTRLYSTKNVLELAVARKLADQGLKLELIRDIMRSGRLRASNDGFDPWDPGKEIDPEGRRFFLLIYDPASENPVLVSTGCQAGQALKVTSQYGARPASFEVCVIVDLTAIREKIRSTLG